MTLAFSAVFVDEAQADAEPILLAAFVDPIEVFGGGVTPPVSRKVLLGLRFISEELAAAGEVTVHGGESIVFPGEAGKFTIIIKEKVSRRSCRQLFSFGENLYYNFFFFFS